jgi:Ser/Thr protein kinase RdoA (MazF antagonist)
VPHLLARDGNRILLAEIPGADLYDAGPPILQEMVTLLVDLQHAWSDRGAALHGLGLPDWRAPSLSAAIGAVFERTSDAVPGADRDVLARFVDDLPARFARLEACGLGDTLIHGDFHPGNFRGDGQSLVLLDWGDSGVGHPLLDQSAFLPRVPDDAVAPVQTHWAAAWREKAAGCDPLRAARLIAPIAAARQAVVYQRFLDAIEPSEQPYHRSDPVAWLQRAAGILREELA